MIQYRECVKEMIQSAQKAGLTRFHGFLTVILEKDKYGTVIQSDEVSVIWYADHPAEVKLEFKSKRSASVLGLANGTCEIKLSELG